ncbi:hypothetical protein COEREDRAFT_10058 [Coemansia reversa NRRL 1564]|uniref:Uncharacterized protein n=1 Tax=Coemansia reversa (strain ATCC 12441 / NRRL 1564) TaxID=763665 RepID=A0A2G5B715_COERN|nr:hypothetical protein COEREDRAFT_10058 [Coemansia reversa NRRL 1564]|eukprot:PIA14799.1 hypothetical protein COEREDRAFT_10058 [Coemansia reversa NRRL 1564]
MREKKAVAGNPGVQVDKAQRASADGGDSDAGIVGSLNVCPVWSSCRACRRGVMLARLLSLRPRRDVRYPAAGGVTGPLSGKKAARNQSQAAAVHSAPTVTWSGNQQKVRVTNSDTRIRGNNIRAQGTPQFPAAVLLHSKAHICI